MSHDDRDQAGASAQCPCFLFGAKGKRRHRVPRRQAKVSISVQQDQDQEDGKAEVIVEPKTASSQSFWQAKTAFVRIACTSCPPSNLPAVVGSLPAQYLGRGPGPI